MDLLGAVGVLGDWFSLAVTAGLVAVLVLAGIVTRQIGLLHGLHNYVVAMVVSAAILPSLLARQSSARGFIRHSKTGGAALKSHNTRETMN